MWYHRVIGGGRCPIVDTWWQTETGAILISPLPATTATKPGSCTKPLPGIDADIVDEEGTLVTRPEAGGYLVIKKPWPGMLRTLWRDNDRYIAAYWGKFDNRYYVAGDSARRDRDGYFWIMGRIDDVLNVAGHRLGTMEIESALVANPLVAEAAVVGKPHEIKGEAVFAFVVCRGPRPTGDTSELVQKLRDWVGEQVGAIAKPDDIRFADNLPKTRSGKIMRRLLRSIARGEEILQDVSTLENPAILDQLRGADTGSASGAPGLVARKTKATAKAQPKTSSKAQPKAQPQSRPSKATKGAAKKASNAAPKAAAPKRAASKASKGSSKPSRASAKKTPKAPPKRASSVAKQPSKRVSAKAPKRDAASRQSARKAAGKGASNRTSAKGSAAPSRSSVKTRG